MKYQQYFRFSIYASLISLLLILQNTQHLLDLHFILMIITIWTCLLFFAYLEQQQDFLRAEIMAEIKQHPQVSFDIIKQTGLSQTDLFGLAPTHRFKYTTLKFILKLIRHNRKDASC